MRFVISSHSMEGHSVDGEQRIQSTSSWIENRLLGWMEHNKSMRFFPLSQRKMSNSYANLLNIFHGCTDYTCNLFCFARIDSAQKMAKCYLWLWLLLCTLHAIVQPNSIDIMDRTGPHFYYSIAAAVLPCKWNYIETSSFLGNWYRCTIRFTWRGHNEPLLVTIVFARFLYLCIQINSIFDLLLIYGHACYAYGSA